MTPRIWVELIAALTGPIAIVGLILHRIIRDYGIGARAVQFAAVVLLIPTVLILGLERVLDGAALGTLIAGIAGYVLWKVGEYAPDRHSQTKSPSSGSNLSSDGPSDGADNDF